MRLSQPNGAGWALEMDLHGTSLEQCFRPSDGDSVPELQACLESMGRELLAHPDLGNG